MNMMMVTLIGQSYDGQGNSTEGTPEEDMIDGTVLILPCPERMLRLGSIGEQELNEQLAKPNLPGKLPLEWYPVMLGLRKDIQLVKMHSLFRYFISVSFHFSKRVLFSK